jgi:hypothetical protein
MKKKEKKLQGIIVGQMYEIAKIQMYFQWPMFKCHVA